MESRASCPRRFLRQSQHMGWINHKCLRRNARARCRKCHKQHLCPRHTTAAVHTRVLLRSTTSRVHRSNSLASAASRRTTLRTPTMACRNSFRPMPPTVDHTSQSKPKQMYTSSCRLISTRRKDLRQRIRTLDSRCTHNRFSRNNHSSRPIPIITTACRLNSLPTRCLARVHGTRSRPTTTITGHQVSSDSPGCQSQRLDPKAPSSSSRPKTMHFSSSLKRRRISPGSRLPISSLGEVRALFKYDTAPNSRPRRQFGQTKWYVSHS